MPIITRECLKIFLNISDMRFQIDNFSQNTTCFLGINRSHDRVFRQNLYPIFNSLIYTGYLWLIKKQLL